MGKSGVKNLVEKVHNKLEVQNGYPQWGYWQKI